MGEDEGRVLGSANDVSTSFDAMAMSDSLFRALDGTFGADACDARERQAAERDRQRAMDSLRAASLRRVRRKYRTRRNVLAQMINDAISKYVRTCETAALDDTRKKMRMITSLRREDRYRAFLAMGSKDELLKRLGQTIDAAEAMIEINSPERFEAYYAAAASCLAGRVSAMESIKVALADDEQSDASFANDPTCVDREDPDDAVARAIEDVYASCFGEKMRNAFEITGHDERRQKLVGEIEDVERRAMIEVQELMRSRARQIAGHCVGTIELPTFEGVACERAIGLERLEVLLSEVRASYASYVRCVQQGGLACAFGVGLGSGRQGYVPILRLRQSLSDVYESDDCGFDVSEHFDIPDFYDEDAHAGGDDIDKAIKRMREFNAQPFRDVLVDDPAEHARQFWYGLKKLLVFAEDAIDIDERKWDAFVDRVEFAAQQAMVVFVRQMDAGQAFQLRRDLEDLLGSSE